MPRRPTSRAGPPARLTRVRRWTGPPLDQGRESPAHPRCPDAAVWPGRGGGARHDPLGALGGLALAGIVVAGRTMPIGWAVIPYPWPKGRFHNRSARPAAAGRLPTRGAVDSGGGPWLSECSPLCPTPSKGYQVQRRLRLSDWVMVARVYTTVAEHLVAGRLVDGQRTAATMGRGRPDQPLVPGWVVVSTAVVAPPKHKQNLARPASGPSGPRPMPSTARTSRAARRSHRVPRRSAMPRPGCSSLRAPTVSQAVAEYAQRMPIEETFRDWHSGWGVRGSGRSPDGSDGRPAHWGGLCDL